MPSVALETVGFDNDHLHMLMVIPPKYSIASVMAQLKSQSASGYDDSKEMLAPFEYKGYTDQYLFGYWFELRRKFKWLQKVYWKENIV